jgi:hypothetical protein
VAEVRVSQIDKTSGNGEDGKTLNYMAASISTIYYAPKSFVTVNFAW